MSLLSGSLFAALALLVAPLTAQQEEGDADAAIYPAEGYQSQEERQRAIIRSDAQRQGELQLRYARELFDGGQHRPALRELEHFILLHPGHPLELAAWEMIARLHRRMDLPGRALESYLTIRRLSYLTERGDAAYLQAGRLYSELGDKERARRVYQELIESRPDSTVAREAAVALNSLRFSEPLPRERDQSDADDRESEKNSEQRVESGWERLDHIGEGLELPLQ